MDGDRQGFASWRGRGLNELRRRRSTLQCSLRSLDAASLGSNSQPFDALEVEKSNETGEPYEAEKDGVNCDRWPQDVTQRKPQERRCQATARPGR